MLPSSACSFGAGVVLGFGCYARFGLIGIGMAQIVDCHWRRKNLVPSYWRSLLEDSTSGCRCVELIKCLQILVPDFVFYILVWE